MFSLKREQELVGEGKKRLFGEVETILTLEVCNGNNTLETIWRSKFIEKRNG